MNSAGSSIMTDQTVEVITEYLKLEQRIGGYECMVQKAEDFEEFYTRTAQLINAQSVNEIAFTDGGSRGWNALINGIDLNKIDSFITLSSEYLTNISTLQICAEKYNKNLHVLPCSVNGDFDIRKLEKLAQSHKSCIAISQATAQGSITNPVESIGQIAKKTNSIYIVDATQSIGQIPLDVQAFQCDALTATGRKWLRGPRGTGFIYVKEGAPFSSNVIDGSSSKVLREDAHITVIKVGSARQFEMWERNYGLMLGLSNAIFEYMTLGPEMVHQRILEYAEQIRAIVDSNPRLQLVGKTNSKSGIIGIVAQSDDCLEQIKSAFQTHDITFNLVYEWACPLFFDGETKVIRLAAHHDVSSEHIDKVCRVLSEI